MNVPLELETLRDYLRFAVSRFNEAGLAFGHGFANAYDEAAYLLLHALHLPNDRLEPFLDARLSASECADLAATVESLRAAGARLRNEIVVGRGGKQILLEDPSGNPIELFEPDR